MWIVAPSIPPGMKEFLAHLGIEYTEIHEAEFIRVATTTGYAMRSSASVEHVASPTEVMSTAAQVQDPIVNIASRRSRKTTQNQGETNEWGFGQGTQPAFLIRALENGNKTKQQISSEYIAHFHPDPYVFTSKEHQRFWSVLF